MRRLPSWLFIAALVTLLLEIFVVIQVGQLIGPLWTVALLVVGSALGAWLIKREGRKAWRSFQGAVNSGKVPSEELADGMLVLTGGTLMLIPGFVTDVIGALLILPVTRGLGRPLLGAVVGRRVVTAGASFPQTPRTQQRPRPDDVVQGEVVD